MWWRQTDRERHAESGHYGIYMEIRLKKWAFTISKVTGGKNKQGWFISGTTNTSLVFVFRLTVHYICYERCFLSHRLGAGWWDRSWWNPRSLMPHLNHYLLSIFQLNRACFSCFLGGIQKCLGRRAQHLLSFSERKKKQKAKSNPHHMSDPFQVTAEIHNYCTQPCQ